MIQMLRKRLDKKEEGFTLIELMVVVLIIAILLAIAIPTFLGARSRAQNRSAQSNLRNALTAEKTAYTDAQSYSSDTVALQSIEPSLTFVAATPATGANQVEVVTADTNATVCLSAVSASGKQYWIGDNGSGTYYSSTAAPTCTSAAMKALTNWATTTTGASW
jgi:type IV pilus assembly protein PilA